MTNTNDTKFEELLRTHTAFDSADALITSMTEGGYVPTLRVPKLTARSSQAIRTQHDAMVFMRSYLTERGLEVFPPEDHVKAQKNL